MKTVKERKGKQSGKRCVLAYGEVSGHHHQFANENTAVLEGSKLTVKKKDDLVHDEHSAHTLEPGIGEVTIQREYRLGSLKRVVD